MPSRRDSRRGICVAARDATALTLLVVAGLYAAAQAQAVVLPPPHLGVALSAPAAPAVGGSPPTSVAYSWRRCNRYTSLVTIDGASHLWQLGGDAGTTAPDFLGTTPGQYSRAGHASAADGALTGETDPAATFDGVSDSVSAAGAPGQPGTAPYTIEAWVRPRTVVATPRYLFARGSSSGTRQGTGIWLSSAGLGFERWTNGIRAGITLAAGLPLHAWSLVTATYRLRAGGTSNSTQARATSTSRPASTRPARRS